MATTKPTIIEEFKKAHEFWDDSWHKLFEEQVNAGNIRGTGERYRDGRQRCTLSEHGEALLAELAAKVPTVPPPTPADILRAMSIIDFGMWHDTGATEPRYYHVDVIRLSDGMTLTNGSALSPELAAAYAWVNAWSPDALTDNRVAREQVPLSVPPGEYRFELRKPDDKFFVNINEVLCERSYDERVVRPKFVARLARSIVHSSALCNLVAVSRVLQTPVTFLIVSGLSLDDHSHDPQTSKEPNRHDDPISDDIDQHPLPQRQV